MLLISAATLGLLATMTQTSRLRPRSRYPLFIAAALLTLGLAGLAAAIAWGGPHDIPPLSSINNPFKGVDYGGVPPAQRYTARDGTSLAWHGYSPSPATAATPQRRVVLVHGSSARGQSNHVLAQALAAEGYAVASWTFGVTARPAPGARPRTSARWKTTSRTFCAPCRTLARKR